MERKREGSESCTCSNVSSLSSKLPTAPLKSFLAHLLGVSVQGLVVRSCFQNVAQMDLEEKNTHLE